MTTKYYIKRTHRHPDFEANIVRYWTGIEWSSNSAKGYSRKINAEKAAHKLTRNGEFGLSIQSE